MGAYPQTPGGTGHSQARILAEPSQLVYTAALSPFLQHLNTRIIFTLLINGMVVHRMVTPSISNLPVFILAQEHIVITPATA